jgi:hypothetical protein
VAPFGTGIWAVVVTSVIAVILSFAYFDQPSIVRGAFAIGALALFGRQLRTFLGRQRT